MLKTAIILTCWILSVFSNLFAQNNAALTFSEVMFAPATGESEFIEIYNTSASDTIDLSNFQLKYLHTSNTDKIIAHKSGTVLLPVSFAVIFEEDYDFLSGIYNSSIPQEALILKIDNGSFASGLSNSSSRTLLLVSSSGDTLDVYTYSADNSKGFSDEKIELNKNNTAENWGNSSILNGTPGSYNSVSPLKYDLAISNYSFMPDSQFVGRNISLNISITNQGTDEADFFTVEIYDDVNFDSASAINELLYSKDYFTLHRNDSINIEYIIESLEKRNYQFIVSIIYTKDENLLNNKLFAEIIPLPQPADYNDVILNEIMYDPPGIEPEWIELYNNTARIIDLSDWKFADKVSSSELSGIISPENYFIISSDSSINNFYRLDSSLIISLPSLNNGGDNLFLLDQYNNVIDSLMYESFWGGDGKSLERIDPLAETQSQDNWASSKNIIGSTPGYINSVTQKDYDAGIIGLLLDPAEPYYGNKVSLSAAVKNFGKISASFYINLFSNNEVIEQSQRISLSPNDSILYKFNYEIYELLKEEKYVVNLGFENDEDTTNNIVSQLINPGYTYNSVIVNELMYTPQNGEPEWIEIYNKGNHIVDLKGWGIFDILNSAQRTSITDSNFYFQPNTYLIISKDSSIIDYYNYIPSDILFVPFANLNNSEDGTVLKDIYENLIDSVHYNSIWSGKTGYSLERKNYDGESNDISNWEYSKDINQATPGKINSISKRNYDLYAADIILNSLPVYGETNSPGVQIKNIGLKTADHYSVVFYLNDINNIWDRVDGASINVNDSIVIKSTKEFVIGTSNGISAEVIFNIDGDTTNNSVHKEFLSSYVGRDIIINELMINPNRDEPEWVELMNNSTHDINLKGFRISDALPKPNKEILSVNNYLMQPHEYIIITPDSILFSNTYNNESEIFEVNAGTLDNGEDGVYIYDSYNFIIDSILYNPDWDIIKGYSLERISAGAESGNISNWRTSINPNGSTPGNINSVSNSQEYSFNQVVINEIMYEPSNDNSEFIELYNSSDNYINLGGWTLQSGANDRIRLTNSSFSFPPHSYFITASDSLILDFYNFHEEDLLFNIVGKDLGLRNDGQIILIRDIRSNLIDSVYYNSSWHNPNFIETRNVSLERLRPDIDSNIPSNWSSSAGNKGATPGSINSIYLNSEISEAELNISPNPFSPDNDGFEDFCSINYSLPISLSQIRIKIFDDRGRLVRTLVNNQPSGSEGSIIFDGLKENNSPLRIGMYIVYFEATNALSGEQKILKDVVVIAGKL